MRAAEAARQPERVFIADTISWAILHWGATHPWRSWVWSGGQRANFRPGLAVRGAVLLGRWISPCLGPGTPPSMGCLGNRPATAEVPVPQGKNNCINMDSCLPAPEGKTWQK